MSIKIILIEIWRDFQKAIKLYVTSALKIYKNFQVITVTTFATLKNNILFFQTLANAEQ